MIRGTSAWLRERGLGGDANHSFDIPHAAATFSRKPLVLLSGKKSSVFHAQLFGRAFKAVMQFRRVCSSSIPILHLGDDVVVSA